MSECQLTFVILICVCLCDVTRCNHVDLDKNVNSTSENARGYILKSDDTTRALTLMSFKLFILVIFVASAVSAVHCYIAKRQKRALRSDADDIDAAPEHGLTSFIVQNGQIVERRITRNECMASTCDDNIHNAVHVLFTSAAISSSVSPPSYTPPRKYDNAPPPRYEVAVTSRSTNELKPEAPPSYRAGDSDSFNLQR